MTSASEVLRRGDRLARLRLAGVRDPIRYVRSEAETRRALVELAAASARSRRFDRTAVVVSGEPELAPRACGWCGAPDALPGLAVCLEHVDVERAFAESGLRSTVRVNYVKEVGSVST